MKFAYVVPLVAAALLVRGGTPASAAPLARPVAQLGAAPLYGARDIGHAAAAGRIDFSIVLPYQHAAELSYLLAAQNDASSRYYGRYLKAAQFRSYFAPTEATYAAAARALHAAGFAIRTSENRTVLHATGITSATERFFATRLDAVRERNGRLAYANVTRALLPATLAGSRVVGLSNVIVARTTVSDRSARPKRPAVTFGGMLFGPDGGYGPLAVAKPEDYPVEHGYHGTNSNVADLIDGPVADSDVAAYLAYFGIRRAGPRTTTIDVDGGCGAECDDGFTAVIDAESILGVAPGASLFTYEIPSLQNGAIADGFNAIVSDDAVNIVNFSIGACEISGGDLQLAIEPIIAQGAAEGITFESVAFGGADLCGLGIDLPMTPANLDTLTAVGGATAIVDNSGKLLAESALPSSNGGISLTIPTPAWQAKTHGVSKAGRNVPDVVLPGSVDGVGPSIYYDGQWQGGFVFVNNAPFAGYLATVQQLHGYATPLGNVAPKLYSTFNVHGYGGGSAAYFADVSLGNIGAIGGVPVEAKTGYDLATGIGTIKGGFALAKKL